MENFTDVEIEKFFKICSLFYISPKFEKYKNKNYNNSSNYALGIIFVPIFMLSQVHNPSINVQS